MPGSVEGVPSDAMSCSISVGIQESSVSCDATCPLTRRLVADIVAASAGVMDGRVFNLDPGALIVATGSAISGDGDSEMGWRMTELGVPGTVPASVSNEGIDGGCNRSSGVAGRSSSCTFAARSACIVSCTDCTAGGEGVIVSVFNEGIDAGCDRSPGVVGRLFSWTFASRNACTLSCTDCTAGGEGIIYDSMAKSKLLPVSKHGSGRLALIGEESLVVLFGRLSSCIFAARSACTVPCTDCTAGGEGVTYDSIAKSKLLPVSKHGSGRLALIGEESPVVLFGRLSLCIFTGRSACSVSCTDCTAGGEGAIYDSIPMSKPFPAPRPGSGRIALVGEEPPVPL
jgi:hypothetical protein